MILVFALLTFFCLVGLAARRFGASVQWMLLAGIVTMIMLALARGTFYQ